MNNQTKKLMYVNKSAQAVLDERQRQIDVEGWTPEHDDDHLGHELGLAAACYISAEPPYPYMEPPEAWPWDEEWWKPRNYRRNLVKAGAFPGAQFQPVSLILAEIERLDRQVDCLLSDV